MIATPEGFRICLKYATQLDKEIGLKHAKNINNLFVEKFDARKVGNIN